MYPVSNDYLTAMMEHSCERRIRGTIGNIAFTEDDLVSNSFLITNMCAEESDMKIGGVYMGELSMMFVPSFLSKVTRTQYKDKEVTISIGLKVGNEWVDVPCGFYTLQAPKISKEGISVTGNDNMAKFDKSFGASTISGYFWDMLSVICHDCGVELGMTQEEVEALPNGDQQLSMYSENDVETYRDLLYWIAQTAGRFATINRAGQLELRKFGVPTGVEIDEMHRDIDVVFSGYTTKWTGISVVNMADGMTKYYGLDPDDGLTMNLGQNPLVQYGLDEVVDAQRIAILNEIAQIRYTPFTFTSVRDPIFDLGDEIDFVGGLSDNCTGCIMNYSIALNNYEFQSYGDDPELSNARNKVDKDISGLLSKTESNYVYYYSYENITPFLILDNQETKIADIKFAAKKVTDVIIQCEFKVQIENTAEPERTIVYHDEEIPDDPETVENENEVVTTEIGYFDKVEEPMVAYIRYYYDDVLIDYQPIETWSEEGYHVFSGFYHMKDVDIEQEHEFKVKLLLSGANGEIAIKDSHLLISGQGLVSPDKAWYGNIEAFDEMPRYNIHTISVIAFEDSAEITLMNDDTVTASDEMQRPDIKRITAIPFTDHEPSIVLRNIVYNLVTEDGESNLVTEDKNYNITTEGND